jgi:tetratricopeptide (TPR) repeat protein
MAVNRDVYFDVIVYKYTLSRKIARLSQVALALSLCVIIGVGCPSDVYAQTQLQTSSGESDTQKQLALLEVRLLSEEGIDLYRQNRFVEALPLAKKVLAILERAFGADHPNTATALNLLALLYYNQGNYAEADPLVKRAMSINEKSLRPDHQATTSSFSDLAGWILQKLESYSDAELLLKRAIDIYEKALGSEHPYTAIALTNLADLYLKQGRYTDAELQLKRAIDIYEKALGSAHPYTATALNGLAVLYENELRYQEAETFFKRATAIYEKVLAEHPYTAQSLNNLADLYYSQGRYAEAEPLFKRTLAIKEKVLGLEHPYTATALNGLALLYYSQGRYTEAEPLLKRAMAINEKALGSEHPATASSLNNLAGWIYNNQGRYAEAEPLLKRAIAIYEKTLGSEHPYTATALISLAVLYHNQRRYQKADTLYKRATAIYEKTLGAEHPYTAQSINNLAVLYKDQGYYQEAEPLYKRALAIREKVLGPEHPAIASSLSNLAILYLAQGKTELALQDFTRARDIEERILETQLAAGSEDQRLAFANTYNSSIPIDLSVHLQAAPQNLQAAHLALATLLQRKGRVLDTVALDLQTLRKKLQPQERDLFDKWQQALSNYSSLALRGPGTQPTNTYRQSLDTQFQQKRRLEEQLFKRSTEIRQRIQAVTVEDVQHSLPKGAVLIEFSRYEPFDFKATVTTQKWGKLRYAAYILGSDGSLHWKDLGDAEIIETSVKQLRQALSQVNPISKIPLSSIEQVQQRARVVDQLLLEPIRPWLAESSLVFISPDGELNRLPFEVLVDPQARYFLKQHTVQYLGSGRDLLRLASPTQDTSTSAILIGAPDYLSRKQRSTLNAYSRHCLPALRQLQ